MLRPRIHVSLVQNQPFNTHLWGRGREHVNISQNAMTLDDQSCVTSVKYRQRHRHIYIPVEVECENFLVFNQFIHELATCSSHDTVP